MLMPIVRDRTFARREARVVSGSPPHRPFSLFLPFFSSPPPSIPIAIGGIPFSCSYRKTRALRGTIPRAGGRADGRERDRERDVKVKSDFPSQPVWRRVPGDEG